jgi:DnaK suppressor protein
MIADGAGHEKRPTLAGNLDRTPLPTISSSFPVEFGGAVVMKKKERDKFEKILLEKRMRLLVNARQTLDSEMTLDQADLADEMDLASSEYLQSFQFRLRGRERTFLSKIDKALKKLNDGTFGVCEECGEEIHTKRLEARPETNLCIKCKEEQEREESQFGDE